MEKLLKLRQNLQNNLTFFILILTLPGFSQVEYTDLTPDKFVGWNNTEYPLDIDQDGNIDFTFKYSQSHIPYSTIHTFVIKNHLYAQVAKTNSSVSVINQGETIDHDLIWSHLSESLLLKYALGWGSIGEGNWLDVTDGFIGLRIKNGDAYQYAWMRIYILNNTALFLADFGLGTEPDEAILAGESMPDEATSLFLHDVNDHFDGRDFKVSFTKAYNEDRFSAYRIILSKADDSTAYDLDVMNQIPESRYVEIPIDSLNTSHTIEYEMTQDATDKDGDAFAILSAYRAHLLNIDKNGIATENVLSASSPPTRIQAFSETVKNPVGFDNSNNNNAGDIAVQFNKVSREDFIGEYRAFVIEYGGAEEFDLLTALSLSSEFYTTQEPNGENVQVSINDDQLEVSGTPISEEVEYQAIVLS